MCRVNKHIYNEFTSNKETEYFSLDEVEFNNLIGTPFVLKSRFILEPLFYDQYIIPEGIRILEVELEKDTEPDFIST